MPTCASLRMRVGGRRSGRASVDPGYGHPLGGGVDLLEGALQDADRLVDVVVDNGQVEEVAVGCLQGVGLASELLQASVVILERQERSKHTIAIDNKVIASHFPQVTVAKRIEVRF